MNKPTVTVCVPAYNEQHNIDNILKQIFLQKQEDFTIEKVIVASDGSTDNTVKIARKYISLGVEVIEGKENLGQTYRQNEMMSKTTSDILILLNADLQLGTRDVISRLITPLLNGADLSAQWAKPIKPTTFIEKVLYAGFILKNYVYIRHKNGNNIYTCVGHMRALSYKLYSTIRFPDISHGEDQYLYLKCIEQGYRYEYAHADNVFFRLPSIFSEYRIYAKRIFQTQKKYGDVFNEKLILNERYIPLFLKVRGSFYAFMKMPAYTILYIVLHMLIQKWSLMQPESHSDTFQISKSTKIFNNNYIQSFE